MRLAFRAEYGILCSGVTSMSEQHCNDEIELILSEPAGVTAPADLGVPAAVLYVFMFVLWVLAQKNGRRGSKRSKSGLERLLEADARAQKESDERVAVAARREEEGGW